MSSSGLVEIVRSDGGLVVAGAGLTDEAVGKLAQSAVVASLATIEYCPLSMLPFVPREAFAFVLLGKARAVTLWTWLVAWSGGICCLCAKRLWAWNLRRYASIGG